MRSTIEHGIFFPEKDSIPQHSAMANGINHRLVFDYQQYLHQPFYLAYSDLKSCYDQIFPSAASLALQRLGMSLLSIVSIHDTIQRMLHMVKLAYGDSNITYGGDTTPNKYRHFTKVLCQGHGSVTKIWSIISSIVFSAL